MQRRGCGEHEAKEHVPTELAAEVAQHGDLFFVRVASNASSTEAWGVKCLRWPGLALQAFPLATHVAKMDVDTYLSPEHLVSSLQAALSMHGPDALLYSGLYSHACRVPVGAVSPSTRRPVWAGGPPAGCDVHLRYFLRPEQNGRARKCTQPPPPPKGDRKAPQQAWCRTDFSAAGRFEMRCDAGCAVGDKAHGAANATAAHLPSTPAFACYSYAQGGFYALSRPLVARIAPRLERRAADRRWRCVDASGFEDRLIGKTIAALDAEGNATVQVHDMRGHADMMCIGLRCRNRRGLIFKHFYYGFKFINSYKNECGAQSDRCCTPDARFPVVNGE